MNLLFGSDDQVANWDYLLTALRHGGTQDKPILPPCAPGQPPEHRPVVDVEYDASAGLLDDLSGCAARRIHRLLRQMRPVDKNCACRRQPFWVQVGLRNCHIRAIFPEENEWERLPIADAENDEGGQSVRIRDHTRDIDPLFGKLLANEPAHMISADPREEPRLEPQARTAGRRVGRAAADVLRERQHALEAAADLLTVEVDT